MREQSPPSQPGIHPFTGADRLLVCNEPPLLVVGRGIAQDRAPVLNFSRFYAITFLFLAPCFVLGGISLLSLITKTIPKTKINPHWTLGTNTVILVIAIIAASYFVSQSGFVNHYAGGSIQSYTLDWDRTLNLNMETSSEPAVKINFYNAYTPEQDVRSSQWLSTNMPTDALIHADATANYHALHVFGSISNINTLDIPKSVIVQNNSFVYLRTFNVKNGFIVPLGDPVYKINNVYSEFNNTNLVYSNGDSLIYKSPT